MPQPDPRGPSAGAGKPSPDAALLAERGRGRPADAAICNACRYCEGFCAVFPAMTRRLEFARGDVDYLANLCHNCGACYYACQYAPPHEFAVNVPQAMARVRGETYAKYAWPARLGALYQRNGLTRRARAGRRPRTVHRPGDGADGHADRRAARRQLLRRVFPHGLLVALFGGAFGYAILALGIGVTRFWRGDATASGDAAGGRRVRGERVAAQVSRRRSRRRLQRVRRPLHTGAAALPSPDVLRLSALLRRDGHGDVLPLRARPVRPVSGRQPARGAWHAGRRRSARSGRPACCG